MSYKYKLCLGENFSFEGSGSDFKKAVRQEMERHNKDFTVEMLDEAENYAEEFFLHLFTPNNPLPIEKFQPYLGNGELIERIPLGKEQISNDKYLSFKEYEYYINLRSATVTLIALLLDITATNGVSSAVLALLGINCKSLAHIPSENGERCVLIETCRRERRTANKDIFKKISGLECVNNNLSCRFCKDSLCCITDTDVDALFNSLVKKNVLSKLDDRFKYNI
jgi:hypothetical protein